MTTVQIPTRRLIFASAVAMVLALAPMIAVFAGPTVAPHAIAQENVQAATRRTTTPSSVLPARCLTSTTNSAKQRWLNQASTRHRAVVAAAVAAGALLVEAVDIVEQLPHGPSTTR